MAPVLAAGVGARHGWTWVLRAASFRLDQPAAGRPAVGSAVQRDTARSAVIDLLGGLARPAYGELRVLGQDLTTAQGRAAVRRYAGIARASARPQPVRQVRGLADGILVRELGLSRDRPLAQRAHRRAPLSSAR